MNASHLPRSTFRVGLASVIVLACALGSIGLTRAAEEGGADSAAPPKAPAHHAVHTHDAFAGFAKRLDLSAKQQTQVKRLLAMRQTQMHRVWTDPSIDPNERVGAVKLINERTEEQIRALLTDEQRQKYIQARPAHDAPGASQPRIEDWLNAGKTPQHDSSAPPP